MSEPRSQIALLLRGTTASTGIAHGRLYCIETPPAPSDRARVDVTLPDALAESAEELSNLLHGLDPQSDAAGILEFQLAMIEDESLLQPAVHRIAQGAPAHAAWNAVLQAEIEDYESAEDEYFRGRVSDLKDIRDRVARHLLGGREQPIPDHSIVVADDLPPSRFLATNWGQGGIALTGGSVTSHVAMLARARGIPMIVNMASAPGRHAQEAFLDAHAGELIVGATADQRLSLVARQRADENLRREQAEYLHQPAVTRTGQRILVQVNIADPEELKHIHPDSCDGIGLVRTELLLHGDRGLPGEDEQYNIYRRFIEWANGKPVTIRTLDAGADKPISGVTLQDERNPFLGVRGIRLSLRHQDLFRPQLSALLRAAALGPLKIMLPMITVPAEIDDVRDILGEERARLTGMGTRVGNPMLGIMVEVPAAAIAIDEFDADFFSIGSNDLIQYMTACGRDAGTLQHLAQPDNSAVLKLIESVVRHGREAGREVSICGEMAGDPRYIGLLLERGLGILSVAPAALAVVKHSVIHHPA